MKVLVVLLCVILAGCGREKQDRPNTEEEDQPSRTPQAERKKAGTLLWTFETDGSVHSSPAVGTDGTVYVGGAISFTLLMVKRAPKSGSLRRTAW